MHGPINISDTDGLKSGRQMAVRYYKEKWSHLCTFCVQ